MEEKSVKRYTMIHRGLHWLIAVLMFVLYITGFLRMQWMGKRAVLQAFEKNSLGETLSKEQMLDVARSILSPMWKWHELAAYIMLGAFAIKLVYMVIKGIRFPNPFSKNIALKERLQGFVYVLFYLFIGITTFTGFFLEWGGGSLKEPMEAIHKWALYLFPIFILLHLIGIWIAEITDKKGVTSRMIGGD